MATDVVKMVQSVVAEKTAIASKERQLIDNLNRVLSDMGYQVVPTVRGVPRRGRASGPVRGAERTLPCPHCPRRFAHPLHLGRHLAAMHRARGRRRAARPAVKKSRAAAKKAS
jgi:hypothetical protein